MMRMRPSKALTTLFAASMGCHIAAWMPLRMHVGQGPLRSHRRLMQVDYASRRHLSLSAAGAASAIDHKAIEDLQQKVQQGILTRVKVSLHPSLRSYLQLKSTSIKRSVFLPKDVPFDDVRAQIEAQFEMLQGQAYQLYLAVDESCQPLVSIQQLHDVISNGTGLKRIKLVVHPPEGYDSTKLPEYYVDMPDPKAAPSMMMVSFYRFLDVQDPDTVRSQLFGLWKPFGALGRIYVAKEGLNAQMAIPSNVLDRFTRACHSFPGLEGIVINTDHEIPMSMFRESPPFSNLHIRVRDQILRDGLDNELDWYQSGYEMPADEWHEKLDDPNAVILDCRNSYESDVGRFQNAIPLNTTKFSQSWEVIDEVLKDKPKDTPVLMYCTGGIRCVKTGAYVTQKLGFQNVARLKGGIIAYKRTLLEDPRFGNQSASTSPSSDTPVKPFFSEAILENSKFKGVNYVFDNRMGSRITADVLATCDQCGKPSDSVVNCANDKCHVRFIQCSECRAKYRSCCSAACSAVVSDDVLEEKRRQQAAEQQQQAKLTASDRRTVQHAAARYNGEALDSYASMFSERELPLMAELRDVTIRKFKEQGVRMVTGPLQGRFLTSLTQMTNAQTVLELGTFTGYSALCFAAGLPRDGGKVITAEIDPEAAAVAREFFSKSELGLKIDLRLQPAGDVIESLRQQGEKVDLVYLDADKKQYLAYYEAVMGNETHDGILGPNGIILADNVLWKGVVLNHVPELKPEAPPLSSFPNPKRMEKMATIMHEFNARVSSDPRVRCTMLPLRDGLMIIQKK